jgi:hypothetical protein
MNFCSVCGTPFNPGATFCAKCGNNLTFAAGQGHAGMPPMMPPMMDMPVATRTSGMAIAGFVLSFFCGLLGLIFSCIGYSECKNSGGTVTGGGLALAGIIISIVSMLLGVMIAMSGGH